MWLSSPLRRSENICFTSGPSTSIAALFTRAPRLKTTQVAINWWMDKQMEYINTVEWNGPSNKKEGSTDKSYNTDEEIIHQNFSKHYAQWKKPNKRTHCMIPFIWNIQQRQIYTDRKQVRDYAVRREERGSDCEGYKDSHRKGPATACADGCTTL